MSKLSCLFQEVAFDHLRDRLECYLSDYRQYHRVYNKDSNRDKDGISSGSGTTTTDTTTDSTVSNGDKGSKLAMELFDVDLNGIVVVGGVASNLQLRKVLSLIVEEYNYKHKHKHTYKHGNKNANSDSNKYQNSNVNSNSSYEGSGGTSDMSGTSGVKDLQVYFPPPVLCTDNGVMIAWNAIEKLNHTNSSDDYGVTVNQDNKLVLTDIARARWPIS